MGRWLSILVLLLFLLLVGAGLTWYFAYGVEQAPPRRAALAGLGGPVEIDWQTNEAVTIAAQREEDVYVGLGYAHGASHAWTALLWRQTALGRQGEWFGKGVLRMDRLARQLGFAPLARAAYDSLPPPDRALLEAYTRGLNAALEARAVELSDELSLLGLKPEPWEPWHTLALERLFAWLATPRSDTLQTMGADADAFLAADEMLRAYLHLHGFEHSVAWALQDSTGTQFYQRHVYGASALPLYQEVLLRWPEHEVIGASLPGTPFLPAGKSDGRAWALLPTGTANFTWAQQDTVRGGVSYERLTTRAGAEELVRVRRTPRGLQFTPPPRSRRPQPDTLAADTLAAPGRAPAAMTPPPQADTLRRLAAGLPADSVQAPPDSTWMLRWGGFAPVTDFSAWRALLRGEAPSFRLLEGNGLRFLPDGTWEVLGTPIVTRLNGGVVVGNTHWSTFLAADLDSLRRQAGTVLNTRDWAGDYRSAWAEALAPALIASLDSVRNRSAAVEEALTYLENWDYAYDRASIAASIFDTWVSHYQAQTGRLPTRVVPDTVYFENVRRYGTLTATVAELTARFGDDLSQWRWENVSPEMRYFPVWSADSLLDDPGGLIARTRYAPIRLPGRGHPSTPVWGSSPVVDRRPHPAAWEAWTSTDNWTHLHVRRRVLDTERFLGRYRTSNRMPQAVALSFDDASAHRTVLVPAP